MAALGLALANACVVEAAVQIARWCLVAKTTYRDGPMATPLGEVLGCFGGLWRWMGLDGFGQPWAAALHKQFQFVLVCSNVI